MRAISAATRSEERLINPRTMAISPRTSPTELDTL
jgi:hypothetical protein